MSVNLNSETDIVMIPDNYYPSLDSGGNYIDNLSPFNFKKKGITCICGARKDKVYLTQATFAAHCKTASHKKWLESVNLNKANYYVENVKINELLQNQRIIIAKLETDVNNRNITIDYLTKQLTKKSKNLDPIGINLLDFD